MFHWTQKRIFVSFESGKWVTSLSILFKITILFRITILCGNMCVHIFFCLFFLLNIWYWCWHTYIDYCFSDGSSCSLTASWVICVTVNRCASRAYINKTWEGEGHTQRIENETQQGVRVGGWTYWFDTLAMKLRLRDGLFYSFCLTVIWENEFNV